MSEELKILRKLVEILEPHLAREYKQSIDSIGFLTEGTKQSLSVLGKAKKILEENKTSKVERLESLLVRMIERLESVNCSEGYCCCGNSMKDHANCMMGGHVPVDMGIYHKVSLIEEAQEELNKNNGT